MPERTRAAGPDVDERAARPAQPAAVPATAPTPVPNASPEAAGPAALRAAQLLELQRTAGNAAVGQLLGAGVQRDPDPDGDGDGEGGGTATAERATSGELAWEIFSPVATSGIRSLAPGVLKTANLGKHTELVVDVVDKLEDSVNKIRDYEKKVDELTEKAKGEGSEKFSLKSLGKVHAHVASIPDAVAVDGEELIAEAAGVVTGDMFTDMPGAVGKLETFGAVVEETKELRAPYRRMVARLSKAETRVQASFDALAVLEDGLMDIAKVAPHPTYQAWAFGEALKVGGYKHDVGTIRSTLRHKREGYERTIAASGEMEAYMTGAKGRAALAEGYREPVSPQCLARVRGAGAAVFADPEAIYERVLPYDECTFEAIMDSLDFLPIGDSDAFFGITEALRDAYPDRTGEIDAKQDRYESGIKLHVELGEVRPVLEMVNQVLGPVVMPFVFQEYYRFWRDDDRSLLSHRRFTYRFGVEQMRRNVQRLPLAAILAHYFGG